jgi:L-threonylcarbamoyladenylate synthase
MHFRELFFLNFLNWHAFTFFMARIINRDELANDPKLFNELKKSVFIYPTDTIYGLGCDATSEELVIRVRQIKKSLEHPFSIIIPNKNLIFSNCETDGRVQEWVDKLPGPYTLVFKVKKKFFADSVNKNKDSIGIRIPNNWFYNVVKRMKTPVVTTSANVTGNDFMTSLDNLDDEVEKKVDFIVYDGELNGRLSTIVHLETPDVKINER